MSFKPLLDDASFTLGVIDDPPIGDEGEPIEIHHSGEVYRHDAVGLDEQAGSTILMAFDWIELDTDAIRGQMEEAGVSDEVIESELADHQGEPMLMLSSVYPWENVRITMESAVEGLVR